MSLPAVLGHNIATADPADLIEATAPVAAAKLRRLRDDQASAYGSLRMTLDRQQELREAGQAAEARLRHLRRPPSGVAVAEDSPSFKDAKRAADSTAAKLKRLGPIHDQQAAAWTARSNVVRGVEDWLRDALGGGRRIVDLPTSEPALKRGETVVDAIERLRRRGRELAADLHRARSAPVPSAVAKQRMREQIAALAERGRPHVSALIEHRDGEVEFATADHTTLARGTEVSLVGWQSVDTLSLTVWLHRDVLIKKLETEIDQEADDAAAMDDKARAAAIETINRDLAATELEETAACWTGLGAGLPIEFRPDVSPVALLGVRVEAVEQAAPAQESSPERAGWLLKRW